MCVLSMIYDHYRDRWSNPPFGPLGPRPNELPTITDEEIAELKKLIERAREYDRRTGQPDCELESKREALKDLARVQGVELEFD